MRVVHKIEVVVFGVLSKKIGNKTKAVFGIHGWYSEFSCFVNMAALFPFLVTTSFWYLFQTRIITLFNNVDLSNDFYCNLHRTKRAHVIVEVAVRAADEYISDQ